MKGQLFPLISIGITCYNAESTIARALESALAQDWPRIEIVVVDDCSSDGSVSIVQRYACNEKKIKVVVHNQNKGPAGARNTILRHAKGEFLAFFDDDDESMSNRVSCQLKTILAYESSTGHKLVACYAAGIRRYPNGYVMKLPAIGSEGRDVPRGNDIIDYLLLYKRRKGLFYGSGVPACALMARKTTFDELNGFDESLRRVEDVDFAIRLAHKGGHFIGTKECLFVQYATFALDKSPEKNLEAEQKVVKKNRAYLRAKGRYYYAMHWPRLRYLHFKKRYALFVWELIGLFVRYPLSAPRHFISTGPRRLTHERRMRKKI